MQDYRRLTVWEKSHQLALSTYRETDQFPNSERYGLMSQMRRSSVSIPSNIAEGCGRDSQAELIRYLGIAMGSAAELEYQMLLSKDLSDLEPSSFETLIAEVDEVKRMLWGLLQNLQLEDPERTVPAQKRLHCNRNHSN